MIKIRVLSILSDKGVLQKYMKKEKVSVLHENIRGAISPRRNVHRPHFCMMNCFVGGAIKKPWGYDELESSQASNRGSPIVRSRLLV